MAAYKRFEKITVIWLETFRYFWKLVAEDRWLQPEFQLYLFISIGYNS